MFQVTSNGLNRIDIKFGGKLDSQEMKASLDDLIGKSQDIEQGTMLYRIEDFDLPTLGALGVELSRLPELFRTIGKFNRAAVLSDKKWVQKVSEIEGFLLPGLEIKAFSLDEVAAAEAWLFS
ncbi:Protein of unknown function (DUF3478) [Xenococcus sp. PCC 7305]|uniref:STAS/SEC14 domain-containing protein n=1 Tax=Xenococcus sp. PCC 7305 TaxID=102125 RepID=UPI0002AC97B8|nr:STAS/SEC14 domain-containing protein [Xenococcus sp. PCC 7305]ELS00337.1 Protein of unknown function (DUF3478) [Xenococcus sp. PCC 7305]